jgi:hypothetical protein
VVQEQPRQGVFKTPSQPIAGHNGKCLSSQATQEAEIRRIKVPAHPGQSLEDLISSEISWVWWCAPIIPAMVESINLRGSWSAGVGKSEILSPK